uniref:Uncharacterized protein n=1 Tax=Cacopsylla melanoneura TaxID=428564 RepID=A0A8D8UHQ1_9HEMI
MQSTPVIKYHQAPSFDNLLSPIAASDTSSGISMTASPHSAEFSSSTFSSRLDSRSSHSAGVAGSTRVGEQDISTWIGQKNVSQSRDVFDFSALLSPKQVEVYVESDDNRLNTGNSSHDDDKENQAQQERGANSSFSLDEVLAQYECDSHFSNKTANSSKSLAKKTKSMFDISRKKEKKNKMTSALSTLHLDEGIPCDRLRDNAASRTSHTSLLSRRSDYTSMTSLSERSMNSEDYLNTIRKTCSDMYTTAVLPSGRHRNQNETGTMSSSRHANQNETGTLSSGIRNTSACPDRIRRKQNVTLSTTDNNISSQTLPRMFRTPLQTSSVHTNEMNCTRNANHGRSKESPRNTPSGSDRTVSKRASSYEPFSKPSSQTRSRSSECLLGGSKLSLPPSDHNSPHSYASHQSLSERKGEWLCDSLNSLLSHDGVIEKSIGNLTGEVIVQDEQLFLLQNEIDNILVKLRTILATV